MWKLFPPCISLLFSLDKTPADVICCQIYQLTFLAFGTCEIKCQSSLLVLKDVLVPPTFSKTVLLEKPVEVGSIVTRNMCETRSDP
jgi:hypothetical protein